MDEISNDIYHPTLKYNRKIYSKWIVKKTVAGCNRMINLLDAHKDKKICGCSLTKYVPSLYRESKGATGSQATRYWILDKMFENETFSANDRFMDIGCGKARVLAQLIRKNFPGKLYGIELNHDVAEYAKSWTQKYDNVTVFEGDAFEQNFNDYNIFFLGRPFEREFFKQFVVKFEHDLTHPVRVFYWVDQQSGDYLNDRAGWTIHKREWIFKLKGCYVVPCPQRYSIWTFTPENCR